MCGLTGFWQPGGFEEAEARRLVDQMAKRIAHRGPDDQGAWLDAQAGLALGHRRLSVVDLSAAGHQPMVSAGGRFVIAYNGEIYNHLALRQQLGALPWRGHSDTETLLAAIEAWGITRALQACTGMFAIALWDRQERELVLARDRIGEKPLYYGWQGSGARRTLLFGSELKALRAHPAFTAGDHGAVDREALLLFMRHGYVPAPYTIHPGVHKLPPGSFAVFRAAEAAPPIQTYWSPVEAMLHGHAHPLRATPQEAVDRLEHLLREAIGQQMVADVPLGAFLSGGIDSSTVVALMQSQSSRPVRTFSIGFEEEAYDEAPHAKAVATHLGTDHTELYVTAVQAQEVVPSLPEMYDEPFADSSQIPTHLVSRLARSQVTVALSGDAGDELFCGYNRYQVTQAMWHRIRRIPMPLRRAAAAALLAVPEQSWNRIVPLASRWVPGTRHYNRPGEKLHKGARAMQGRDADGFYLHAVSQWSSPGALVPNAIEPQTLLNGAPSPLRALPDVQRMMAYDLLTYLPDDILVKIDRAAMAVSLETRVPLLDHRVVEFAWQLPMALKLRNGITKWALRQVLYRHVPAALVERPKMGFGVPIGEWLRGPLRPWAEELLSARSLAADGLLDPAPIRQAWTAHLQGSANLQYPLWNVLMFQAWRAHQAGSARLAAAA
jgi:asparagine synthase (glutamine-hydrolysing)